MTEQDAQARIAALETAATALLTWIERERDGPLYVEWDEGDLGDWEDGWWEWPETLAKIQNTDEDVWTGYGKDSGLVALSRQLRAALAVAPQERQAP